MKIALFKNVELDFETVCGGEMEDCENYVRTSEYINVEFPPLANDEIIAQQIEILEQAKQNVQAQAERKLTELDHQIGKLLALPQAI